MSAITIINTSTTSTRQYTLTPLFNHEYLTINNELYEIQSASPNTGKYASYLLDSRFISNPELYAVTKVDPLFFALHYFDSLSTNNDDGADGKWQTWDQLLKHLPTPILHALNLTLDVTNTSQVGQLGHLLQVSDLFDDEIVCKFSEDKTLSWLSSKYTRCCVALRQRRVEKKQRMEERRVCGEYSAFSSSFVLAGNEEKESKGDGAHRAGDNQVELTLTDEEENTVQISAFQIIADYLPSSWKTKLLTSLNRSIEDIDEKKTTIATSGEKRPWSAWEGAPLTTKVQANKQNSYGILSSKMFFIFVPE